MTWSMPRIAQVLLPLPLPEAFDYAEPEGMELKVGELVAVPLGPRQVSGAVIALKEAEHRLFLEQRFPGWENRTSYWHVHDIDVAEPADTIAAIDQLVRELINDCQDDNR